MFLAKFRDNPIDFMVDIVYKLHNLKIFSTLTVKVINYENIETDRAKRILIQIKGVSIVKRNGVVVHCGNLHSFQTHYCSINDQKQSLQC